MYSRRARLGPTSPTSPHTLTIQPRSTDPRSPSLGPNSSISGRLVLYSSDVLQYVPSPPLPIPLRPRPLRLKALADRKELLGVELRDIFDENPPHKLAPEARPRMDMKIYTDGANSKWVHPAGGAWGPGGC